ncbi:MAG: hypothetical protein Q9M97_09030 [Candidatus Gracilibacteria bacterium]|nr:hypothetical protein [Candidatus Gracilibacteria bacterium]
MKSFEKVRDIIDGEKHRNKGLIRKYKSLGFERQKGEDGEYLIEKWGKNDKNSDFVMIRKKSA